jgi:hypothetical protein
MSENGNKVAKFAYPDETTAALCKERLACIHMLKQETIANLAKIGGLLEEVKAALPHGQFGPWLACHWGGSEDTARRCRLLYKHLPRIPQIAEFESVTAAVEFVSLEDWQREAVLERRAFTWNEYRRAVWDATTRHHLTDDGIPHDRRYGDVRHAIEEAGDDPVLADVAATLYEENRDTFAALEDEHPAVVDVEVGIQWKEPQGDKPNAQLVETEEGHWLMRWTGQGEFPFDALRRLGFVDVRHVGSHLRLWNGGDVPVTLAAYPETNDGPTAKSWQDAVIDAGCSRVNATTLETMYGETL